MSDVVDIETASTESVAEAGCSVTEHIDVGLVLYAGEDEQVADGAVADGDLPEEGGDDSEDSSADMLAELKSQDGPQDVESAGTWRRYQRLLPHQARVLLTECTRLDFVRDVVLDRLHQDVLLAGVDPDLVDAVTVRDAWRRACSPSRWPETRRAIRRVRDEVVRQYHQTSAYQHLRYSKMPAFVSKWKPVKGVLHVVESGSTIPSIGWAPLLEATPPQVIRYAYERWVERQLTTWDASELLTTKPQAWDLTGGAGTGVDLLSILGCQVLSIDLTSMNEQVGTLDARDFPCLLQPEPTFSDEFKSQRQAPRPGIVLFDPSSRGTPSNSSLYGGDPDGAGDPRDFALLDRPSWVETTTDIVRVLTSIVSPGGVVSFLVRHGVRDRGRVEPDPQLLGEVKDALGSSVNIIEEVVVGWGKSRVNQASLAQARAPATHLLLGRPA